MQSGHLGPVLLEAMMVLIPMVLSLTVHEFAHAAVAFRLGDGTAAQMGRLTLNPAAHADLFGSLLLPLMGVAASFEMGFGSVPFFGYAKPTPVNAGNFRRSISVRRGSFLVAAVGPLSNLLLAALAAGGLALAVGSSNGFAAPAGTFCQRMFYVNLSLFVFNLLPVGPLDGQKIVSNLLPPAKAVRFDAFNARYALPLTLAFFVFASSWMRLPIGLLQRGLFALVGL